VEGMDGRTWVEAWCHECGGRSPESSDMSCQEAVCLIDHSSGCACGRALAAYHEAYSMPVGAPPETSSETTDVAGASDGVGGRW
jgi:hypothetical protein